MLIEVRKFSGEAPSIPPRKLGDGIASLAENTRYDKARLDAWEDFNDLQSVAVGTESIFKYQGAFITSSNKRHYVEKIIPNDVRERIVFTEEGTYPKIQSGGASYRLGIPAPTGGGASLNTAGDKSNPLDVETWYYVFTFVTDWGEEGPPSLPTDGVEVGVGGIADLALPTFPTGNYNFGASAKIRIYRSNAGTGDSFFQFVTEATSGQAGATVQDAALSSTLEEVLPSATWIGPPNDNTALYPDGPLQGLVALANGVLAGYSGNTVYLCEPYLPHAWPHSRAVTANIIGIATTTGGAVVITDEGPYALLGTVPQNMILKRMDSDKGCVSEDSIVDMGDYAIYAAEDGLVAVDTRNVKILTEGYFIKEDWEALNPSTISGFRYEDKYIFNYGGYAAATGYIFDPRGGQNAFTRLTGLRFVRGYNAPSDDRSYFIYRPGDLTYRIGEFARGGTLMTPKWESKVFELGKHTSFRVARLVSDAYPASVTVRADNTDRYTIVFANNQPRVIPGGFRAREWQFKFHDFTTLESFAIAESMPEIV